MSIYLALGSNQGDRKANLSEAIRSLEKRGFRVSRISPVVESPAMLPADAAPAWNKVYLNCVIEGNASWTPEQGLGHAKGIEKAMGRQSSRRWSPRIIDIDLLLWHNETRDSESLTIPHPGLAQRPFVLTSLAFLQPTLKIPGSGKTIFELTKAQPIIPLWIGILNITPDSFSDGGAWSDEGKLARQVEDWIAYHVPILDIGAESTRPGAQTLTPTMEWERLHPVLEMLGTRLIDERTRPLISLDSRHVATLEKGLERGVAIINDVTGLTDPNMIDLVKSARCQVVAMHSMDVPVIPGKQLPVDRPAVDQINEWLERKVDTWLDQGLDLNQVILDPGIGFGKTVLQAIELLQNCRRLRNNGLRLLIGHSRKSFMNGFADGPFGERDLETLGISLALCQQGVDMIRVHDPVMHIRAYRAWSQIAAR